MGSFRLAKARRAEEIAAAAALFREYADWLGIDLSFQGFEAELRDLPGKYAPPTGELLLAYSPDGDALGCVALRPLNGAALCEMKRPLCAPGRARPGHRSCSDHRHHSSGARARLRGDATRYAAHDGGGLRTLPALRIYRDTRVLPQSRARNALPRQIARADPRESAVVIGAHISLRCHRPRKRTIQYPSSHHQPWRLPDARFRAA